MRRPKSPTRPAFPSICSAPAHSNFREKARLIIRKLVWRQKGWKASQLDDFGTEASRKVDFGALSTSLMTGVFTDSSWARVEMTRRRNGFIVGLLCQQRKRVAFSCYATSGYINIAGAFLAFFRSGTCFFFLLWSFYQNTHLQRHRYCLMTLFGVTIGYSEIKEHFSPQHLVVTFQARYFPP